MDRISLNLPLDITYVRVAAITSRVLCESFVPPERMSEFAGSVELAVSEACTNAVKYSHSEGGQESFETVFLVGDGSITVEVSDHGPGFDLDKVAPPEFDEHPQGGYGIYLMRDRMDEVSYIRGDEGNLLRMVKSLSRAQEPSQ